MTSESLQSRQRPLDITELGIVVVFDNPAIVLARKFQQGEPARERHRGAERKLTRRRAVDNAWRFSCGRNTDPFVVDWNGNEIDACRQESGACSKVARILNPNSIVRISETRGHQRKRLLSSGGDHDLLRVAANTTCVL